MHFRRVCLESFGYTLPDEIVTTAELERRLAPLYERLRLPEGRLELMTGIRERRFFPPGTRPSTISIESARRAIDASGIDPPYFGALVHGSVCRDFLEPATACRVHHGLGLPGEAMIYDVSNACLGLLNGMIQVANMIELGQIRAGVVVGTECGRELVENTIERLNTDQSLTRDSIKDSIASLTIGSASVAIVLCDEELSRTGNRLDGGGRLLRHEPARAVPQPRAGDDDGDRQRRADAARHGGRARRRFDRFLGGGRLGAGRHRPHVLPPGRRGPSQADVRVARPRSGDRLRHAGNARQHRRGGAADHDGPGHRARPAASAAIAWRCSASARESIARCWPWSGRNELQICGMRTADSPPQSAIG